LVSGQHTLKYLLHGVDLDDDFRSVKLLIDLHSISKQSLVMLNACHQACGPKGVAF